TFHMEKYLTGFFMIFDPDNLRLDIADMGHSHAVLLREGRALRPRGLRSNLPIGIEMDIDPAIHSIALRRGDSFLAYSDGITEQEDGRSEEFGERRFVSAVAESLARGADPRERVSAAVDAFRGKTPQQDDMSFVLLTLDRATGEGREKNGASRSRTEAETVASGF
ncbi:MAG: PP2C family protein-serine/threonine phosphatase, partial [Spirochaetaceae bacterium]|nr:PP2C family protein-serine/threonine phosphatase [Spirochaetaceae bacterium]